ENHGEGGLVDDERLEGRGRFEGGYGFADLDAFNASDGDDVTRGGRFGFVAFEAAGGEEVGDFCGLGFSVEVGDGDFAAAEKRAIKDAADGDAAEEFGVVEIHDMELESGGGITGGGGNFGDYGFKEREKVFGGIAGSAVSDAFARVGVD